MPLRVVLLAAVALNVCLTPPLSADVKLPPLFGDHMVLQSDMAVPIYGTAAAGEKVTIRFRDQEKSVVAGDDGRFTVKLDALKPGGPDRLVVSGTNTITIDDVLVGDVWVGSGQSNMAGKAGSYAKNDASLAKMVEQSVPALRLYRGGKWTAASPQVNGDFSALMFAFGVHLQSELKQPVGLMVGAVGGTPSGYWLTQEMLDKDEHFQNAVREQNAKLDEAKFEQSLKKYEEALAAWEKAAKDGGKKPELKTKPKRPVRPGVCSGRVGHLYEAHIRPFVGYGIRGVLWDQGESGTAIERVYNDIVTPALIRGWRRDWGCGEFPFLVVQKPSGGGCAWDPADPVTANASKFAPQPPKPPAASAGLWRELHIRIANAPNTAIVTCTDLGGGIHPPNKSGYGIRAAKVALGFVHSRPIAYQGPTYASHTIEGDAVRLRFTHVGKGLAAAHSDKLQGFMIAGEDKVFHWGEATIDGDTVVVRSSSVSKPASVRYAWSEQFPWANLFNKDGLPALAFRTDNW